ncbi:MAG: MFS transporter [Spirochaetota bacterium]|nr:MFS transporter [Spirochaetota bacterium]
MTDPSINSNTISRQTASYYLAFFSFGLVAAMLGPALPFLADHAGASISEASVIFIAGALGFFLGANIAGILYDRVKGNPVVALALTITGTAFFFIPLSNSILHIFLLLVFNGIGAGMVVVGSNTLLVWVRSNNLPPWMNGMHLLNGIGAFISPLIITFSITQTNDIILAYRINGVIFLLAALFVLITPSPVIRKKLSKDLKFSKKIIISIVLTAASALLYVGTEVSFSGWIFSFTREVLDSSNKTAGIMTSFFWGSITLGRGISIPLSKKLIPEKILVIDILGSITGIAFILLFSGSAATIAVGTIIFGTFMGSFFPNLLAFTEKHIGITGRVNGIIFTSTALGGMSLPFLSGQLFQRISPYMVMFGLIVYLVINLVLTLINIKRQSDIL